MQNKLIHGGKPRDRVEIIGIYRAMSIRTVQLEVVKSILKVEVLNHATILPTISFKQTYKSRLDTEDSMDTASARKSSEGHFVSVKIEKLKELLMFA